MIDSKNKGELVDLLRARSACLYHACQFKDLVSYFELGGVPSRAKLENGSFPMTHFQTDGADRANNVWDKVFLNLDDFGRWFAQGYNAVPNVYGPFLIRINPSCLLEAQDIAICLRSAASRGFNRQDESLHTLEQVDSLFLHPKDHPKGSTLLKFKSGLQATFGEHAQTIEINCTFPNGIIPHSFWNEIVVDPYDICGTSLHHETLNLTNTYEVNVRVNSRRVKIPKLEYNQLLAVISKEITNPAALPKDQVSPRLIKWGRTIDSKSRLLRRNYFRFAEYLREGTISPLENLFVNTREIFKPSTVSRTHHTSIPHYFNEPNHSVDDSQLEEILQDLGDDMDDWARSSEEGWFYAD